MRRNLASIALLLTLLSGYGFTDSTDSLLSPTVELRQVELKSVGLTAAEFAIHLAVNNPNSLAIVVENIDYDLALDDTPIKEGTIHQRERFAAQSQRDVRVPVSVSYAENLAAVLRALGSTAPSQYRIRGSIKLRGYNERFPFAHKGHFSLGGS